MRIAALLLAFALPAANAQETQTPAGLHPAVMGTTPQLAVQFDGTCCHHDEKAALATIAQGLDIPGTDPYKNPPLAEAARFAMLATVKDLIARGADVHALSAHETAMDAAIDSRNIDVVTLLLAHGVGVNEPINDIGGTALMEAARLGRLDMVKLLLAQGADVKAHDQVGDDALDEASEFHHVDIMALLLDKGADPNRPGLNDELPINEEARAGYLDAVKLMVQRGAKPDEPSGPGQMTPLANASCGELRPGRDQVGVIQFLLQQKAHVSEPNKHGDTPLMMAVREYGREDILRALVAGGADVHSANGDGAKTLEWMLQNDPPGAAPKVKALLAVGENPNVIILNNLPGLFWAIEVRRAPDLVAALAEGKADVNITQRQKPVGEFVGGVPPDYVYSPLIAAVKADSAPMVSALLQAGADPKYKDSEGNAALDLARKANNADLVALLTR